MPFKDPERAREYQRQYQRMRRTSSTGNLSHGLPPPARIQSAEDVRLLLETTINEVREAEADPLVKARCLGYLAGITIKSIETANLEARLIDLEEILKKMGAKS